MEQEQLFHIRYLMHWENSLQAKCNKEESVDTSMTLEEEMSQ